MKDAGFEDMGEYFLKRNNTVAKYIMMRPIIDLCEETVRRSGAWFYRRWCKQEAMDLAGARAVVAAAEDREGESE